MLRSDCTVCVCTRVASNNIPGTMYSECQSFILSFTTDTLFIHFYLYTVSINMFNWVNWVNCQSAFYISLVIVYIVSI